MKEPKLPEAAEDVLKICYDHQLIGQLEFEIRSLLAALANDLKPAHTVELGMDRGGTAALFSKVTGKKTVTVDIAGYYDSRIPKVNVEVVQGNTHDPEVFAKVHQALGCQADFVFIDADHMYEIVKKDFEIWRKIVRPGGWIAFHDIDPNHVSPEICQVSRLWKELPGNKVEFVQTHAQTAAGYLGAIGTGGIGILKL